MSEPKQNTPTSFHVIAGRQDGERVRSRILEEQIQKAVAEGCRRLQIDAYGQHGIGGRLWRAGDQPVFIRITGQPGQRVGSMGFPNTVIEVLGPASDDVGWLNAGAEIVVHGHAGNGAANAMAQGRVFIAGNIGARGMTMTKHNPRFGAPELWVLGSVGDYFGEFMAGGVAVVCGHEAQTPDNILGYRPLVGMVGGKVFLRGPHGGFSQTDARMAPIGDPDWNWLLANLKVFLKKIGRSELLRTFSVRDQWQLLVARTPSEKAGRPVRPVRGFHREVWNAELGAGGLIGDLSRLDRSVIPPAVRPGFPCSGAGSSSARAGWTKPSTLRSLTRRFRLRSAVISARTCACSPAPARSRRWHRWIRPKSGRPASAPSCPSCRR